MKMKIIEFVKEVWKQNRMNYFISCGFISLGCLLLFVKYKAPLEYLLPLGWLLTFGLMYGFSFLLGGKE